MAKKDKRDKGAIASLIRNKPFVAGFLVATVFLTYKIITNESVRTDTSISLREVVLSTPVPNVSPTPDLSSPQPSPIELISTPRPKIASPTPAPIKGIDLRVHGATFDAKPTTNGGGAYRYGVKNGANVTLENDRHADHFETLVTYANLGTDEARDISIEYYVDNTKVAVGKTYIPGGMFNSDSAVPVKIPSSGTHTVRIEIDPEKKLSEVNYANNTFTFTYTVR